MKRNLNHSTAVLLALLLLASSGPAAWAGEESEYEITDQAVDPMGNTVTWPLKEPQVDRDRELEAIVAAFLGEPFDDPPESEAVAAAIAELKAEPPPAGEVFALVTVTDRTTGERRMFTRGFPKPEMAYFLDDPSSAPKGLSYSEGDDVIASEKVEIVVRSVSEHAYTMPKDELTREEEEELDLKERNRGMGLSHRIEQGLRQRIASGEIDITSSQPVPVAITLKEIPRISLPKSGSVGVDGLLWIGLDIEAEREKDVIERKELIAGLQAETVADIDGLGGDVRYASWTSGQIEAEVPAKTIPILAERADVFSLEYVEKDSLLVYQGDDYYQPTNYADFDPAHVGFHGVQSKHPYSSRIVLGLSEECIDVGNPAWDTLNGGPSRGLFFGCDAFGPCTLGSVITNCPNPSFDPAHGTQVTGLMTADFMDNQDPSVTALNRRKMTGTCPECHFLFFQDERLNNRLKFMDAACDFGVDIFESSRGSGASCDGNGWYDGALQALVNCDAVYVQAAGNNGSTGGCSTEFPADHPWTFTVGGMDTDNSCDTAGDYFTASCDYATGASRGGGTYNSSGTASIIDQTAPYRHGSLILPGTANPVQFSSGNGTSFATPQVVGLMADMMDWWEVHVSNSIFFDNRMRNFMLLFGDRSVFPAGTARALNFHDVRWGSGRTVLFPFDDAARWNMRRRSRNIASNNDWSFTTPVNPNATFFKAVVWHDGRDHQNEPRTRLTLDPQGCTAPTRTVSRLDSKVMRVYESILNGSTSPYSRGRCLDTTCRIA